MITGSQDNITKGERARIAKGIAIGLSTGSLFPLLSLLLPVDSILRPILAYIAPIVSAASVFTWTLAKGRLFAIFKEEVVGTLDLILLKRRLLRLEKAAQMVAQTAPNLQPNDSAKLLDEFNEIQAKANEALKRFNKGLEFDDDEQDRA